METLVRTPQAIFMQPQRLKVPLFQRPYVWNRERQWEPLWNDVIRVAERVRLRQPGLARPHFLGAVVMQQVPTQAGLLVERTIIDGQQRLTTLQLLLDALHAELLAVSATAPALRLEPLITNAEPFCSKPEDRFKVWPTNRDRPAFMAVMAAPPPVDHDLVGHTGERMVEAHRFFSLQARQWICLGGPDEINERAALLETVVRDLLQMVVIDLGQDENAQEIFETLNDRGAPLTAADLTKNFVFQQLLDSGADVQAAYEANWQGFETSFWESEISVGRIRLSRSSVFLNHWLVANTGTEVVAREVFSRFKTFSADSGLAMPALLVQLKEAAAVYRDFTESSAKAGPISRLALFGYRTGVLESEVIKPLVLYLLDPQESRIPADQLSKSLTAVESWMVRRMLIRATIKNYNAVVADLIASLRSSASRAVAGDRVEAFLSRQDSDSRYWPDDDEVRSSLTNILAYRSLGRGRLRMVLEALEDHLRGWKHDHTGLGGERVARGAYAIEHVMPQSWQKNWPPAEGFTDDAERDRQVHALGNLTLLTARLNSKVSNSAWCGEHGKRRAVEDSDVLMLNRDILRRAPLAWTDSDIRSRTEYLTNAILEIWPTPEGHKSATGRGPKLRREVDLAEIVSAGVIAAGTRLLARGKKFEGKFATLLSDGRLEVDGKIFDTPSAAAGAIAARVVNGWSFFIVDDNLGRSLRDVRKAYVDEMAVDTEEEFLD